MKGKTIRRMLLAAVALTGALALSGEPQVAKAGTVIESTAASGTQVEKNDNCILDYSDTGKGYFNVKYLESTNKDVKVKLTCPGGTEYVYTVRTKGYEAIPLTEGSGSYKAQVLKNVSGNSYAIILTHSFNAKLDNEFQPYIRPSQYVDYGASTKCVKKAESLCKKAGTDLDKVKKVYKWVIKYFKYDYNKAKTVKSGYLPDLNKVYNAKKGICFDYASTMTAMLRSQGVPVKLVIGYTGSEYHAWINVYSKKKGWITGAIYLAADKWKLMDPTFASTGKSSKSIMKYINNTSNYKKKYSY